MFKKFKDKLAEEVKSSPQRIQQFAQAAQAAVTSASSSISDITNNDLFSIGGDETPTQNSSARSLVEAGAVGGGAPPNHFQDVSLSQTPSPHGAGRDAREATPTNDDQYENERVGSLTGAASHRLRKLSSGSAASDVSFRLPSYDSPNMYHLQSDMEVSASEAESAPGALSLERVTKEQVYAAYRRTQDRYSKYRARYADLARHYKTLERENAKARSVLVETQDKALRRISELREQCALEQSAKAHLENALRVELDERNFKIEALNTKIKLLQSYNGDATPEDINETKEGPSDAVPPAVPNLIDLTEAETPPAEVTPAPEIATLNNKLQKMEQLVAKYKESLKTFKDKNSQLTTEIQIVSNELDKKGKENEQLQAAVKQLTDARQLLQELKENNSELQSKVDNFDKIKADEMAAVKAELEKARSEVQKLNKQIDVFTKREEENAISLAENKLSIHKELESKEAEIKMLKGNLKASSNEVKSYEMIVDELKQSCSKLEEEKVNLNSKLSELQLAKKTISDQETKIEELRKQSQNQEQRISKLTEEYKCLELQMKQETAEKLAMIDRNNYLETRNQQLTEDNSKKNKQIVDLEKELLQNNSNDNQHDEICEILRKERNAAQDEIKVWQGKYNTLESEIKEERVELVKLQSEVEKLLHNYEKLQLENIELIGTVSELQTQIQSETAKKEVAEQQFHVVSEELQTKLTTVKRELSSASDSMKAMEKELHDKVMQEAKSQIMAIEATIRDSYEMKMAEAISNHEKAESSTDADTNKLTEEIEELKQSIKTLSEEKFHLENKIQNYEQLKIEKESVEIKIKVLEGDIAEFNNLKLSFDKVVADNKELQVKVESLNQENITLKSKADQIIKEITTLQDELTGVKDSHDHIEKEKDKLVLRISQMEQDEISKSEKERTLYNDNLTKNEEVKKNVDKLKLEMESLLTEKNKMHNQLLEAQYNSKEKEIEITKFKENNEVWEQKLASILEENNILHEKCERFKQEKESFHESVLKLEQKVSDYEKKIKLQEESSIEKEFLDLRINQLENDLKFATLEKDRLLQESQTLKNEMSNMESEGSEKLRGLKEGFEKEKFEKEQLNKQLQELQKNAENEKSVSNKTIGDLKATDKKKTETIAELQRNISDLNVKHSNLVNEVESLKEKEKHLIDEQQSLKAEKNELNERIRDLSKIESEHQTLQQEYEKLKEDKGRLVSDIEGLQVHLTKVSKDNSQLNDKIREMITHDEDATNDRYKDDASTKWILEIEELKDGLKTRQDQIEDLERQNSILVEEKLELEDQLKSQNSKENGNNNVHNNMEKELEITRLRDKNNDLSEVKMQLESKLADLELMGRSGDSNVLHLEQKNEKLRLSNDKLERRLDEALVSLRHLRALEENTELEYLRNILYEYLTGSGAHSVTLAKVLSAVVKFDDRQTQLVLQREKERQGLLGQLGLL